MTSEKIKRMRQELIAEQLEKIDIEAPFYRFTRYARYVLMCLGIYNNKDVREFFDAPEWGQPENKNFLMEKIRYYLEKYVK